MVVAMRRNHILAVIGLVLALLGPGLVVLVSPAAAGPPTYSGDAPDGVTCTLSLKVSFSPSLTTTGGGTNSSKVTGKLTKCSTNTPAVTITSGTVKGSFFSSPLDCSTLTSTGIQADLTASWKGAVNGSIGGTSYAGKASFSKSTIELSNETTVTKTGGDEGLSFPVSDSTVFGSFGAEGYGGAITGNVYGSDTATQLTALCSAKGGLKSWALKGTVTTGEPNWPTSISATAIGGDQDGLTVSYALGWTLASESGCDVNSCVYDLSSEFSGKMTGSCCAGFSQPVTLPDNTADHNATAEVDFSLGDDGQYHVTFSAWSEEGPYTCPGGGCDVIAAISNTSDEQAAAIWNENNALTLPGSVDPPGGSATFDFSYN
jgi:hypothetical protein